MAWERELSTVVARFVKKHTNRKWGFTVTQLDGSSWDLTQEEMLATLDARMYVMWAVNLGTGEIPDLHILVEVY